MSVISSSNVSTSAANAATVANEFYCGICDVFGHATPSCLKNFAAPFVQATQLAGNVLFLGNPGAGKSTLLNGLVGKAGVFEAGVAPGTGLTTSFSSHTVNNVKYIDTPGLADATMQASAKKEIEKALRSGGDFRICFVVGNDAGKLSTADFATIGLLLNAVGKKLDYGVILNKVPRQFTEKQVNDMKDLALELAEKATDLVPKLHVIKKDSRLDDERNALPSNDVVMELKNFLLTMVPSVAIEAKDVFVLHEERAKELQKRLERARNEWERARNEWERARELAQAETEQIEQRRQRDVQRQNEGFAALLSMASAVQAAGCQHTSAACMKGRCAHSCCHHRK